MTDIPVARLRELLAKATPGPWEAQEPSVEEDPGVTIVGAPLEGLVGATLLWPTEIDAKDTARAEANAALIVEAINALPTLLDALSQPAEAELAEGELLPSRIVSVSVFSMYESCERTTFYVRVTTDEGLTKEVEAHRTGSIYTNGEGLSIEEARDRALIDAATWGDFLGLTPEPFVSEGVTHEPSMRFSTYTYQRNTRAALAAMPTPAEPAPSGWRDISTAPRDGSYIIGGRFGPSRELKWVRDMRWMTAAEAAEADGLADCEADYLSGWDNDGEEFHPTHWQPLSAPAAGNAETVTGEGL